MLIEANCESPTLCNQIVFIAKAAGGVRPIGLLQLLLVEPLREVRSTHPTVSIRVDDLSLQRFGDHNRVALELERASNCMAAKRRQARCEVATKMSKVLGNSVSLRAKLQLRLAPLGVKGRAGLWNRFCVKKASGLDGAASAAGKSKGRVQWIRKIHGRSSISLRQRLAQVARASVSKANHSGVVVTGLNETQLQQPSVRWRRACRSGCMERLSRWCSCRQETSRTLCPTRLRRHRAHARIVGRVDAAGHHGQVHQGSAPLPARQRSALGCSQRPCRRSSLSTTLSCGACMMGVDPRRTCPHSMHILLRRAAAARFVCVHCSFIVRERVLLVSCAFQFLF